MDKKTITIDTKNHDSSKNTDLGATFHFLKSHLILPMKGDNEYISNDEAIKLAKFILAHTNHQYYSVIEKSTKQLRSILFDLNLDQEAIVKFNLIYINRIESAIEKLKKY